jgi:hypothetical protein
MGSEYQDEERERERRRGNGGRVREKINMQEVGEWMKTVVVNLCKRWKTRVGESERRTLSGFHWK